MAGLDTAEHPEADACDEPSKNRGFFAPKLRAPQQVRTKGPEMNQKRFCFGQDAWGLATYTPGQTG
jgi:hypothetical protein